VIGRAGRLLVVAAMLVESLASAGEAVPARAAPGSGLETGGAAQYSAAELYNRGNAYARSGHWGLAVLDYERASLLTPGDPDLAANLALVRARAHLAAEPLANSERLLRAVSPDLCAWLGALGVAALGVGALMVRCARRWRALGVGVVVTGACLVLLPVLDGFMLWPRLHAAVVVTRVAPVRAAPVPMGDSVFELTEAQTVEVLAQREDFVLVQTRDGRRGWIARADVGFVVPRSTAGRGDDTMIDVSGT
jgi:hypothetical protein